LQKKHIGLFFGDTVHRSGTISSAIHVVQAEIIRSTTLLECKKLRRPGSAPCYAGVAHSAPTPS